ncbi:MAG: M20 family metallopeptidase [archaeon]
MVEEKDVINLVNNNKCKLKEILKTLVSANTVNPPGNETLLANNVANIFRKHKIKYRTLSKSKNRANIVATIGKGRKELLFAAHSDTVPADLKLWKTNPFVLAEKNGRFYGRGVDDDKGPAASAILSFILLKKFEKKLNCKVSLAITADEEHGSKNGMQYLIDNNLITPDYAVVLDTGHELKAVSLGEKGILRLRITSFGKSAHASRPFEGINAITNASYLICELQKLKFKHTRQKLFSKPTFNVGTIKGGSATNVVPDSCEFTLDVRYLPGQNSKEIINSIKKLILNVQRKSKKSRFKVAVLMDELPFLSSADNDFLGILSDSAKKITGKKIKHIALSGGTDTRRLAHAGISSIGFGAGNNQAHKNNESIEVKQLVDLTKIILLAAFGFSEKFS